MSGKSLVHSAELTAVAFKSGVLGVYGGYIVAIGLLLFAFSTAIAWSYYGDRSAAYVFGEKSVVWYRLIYVGCFFIAAEKSLPCFISIMTFSIALLKY